MFLIRHLQNIVGYKNAAHDFYRMSDVNIYLKNNLDKRYQAIRLLYELRVFFPLNNPPL